MRGTGGEVAGRGKAMVAGMEKRKKRENRGKCWGGGCSPREKKKNLGFF